MENVFEAAALSKRFGDVTALDGVDIKVPKHSILGLVGKNGSGKTTLLRHLLGLYLPTEGRCWTLGKPSGELGGSELCRIGTVSQELQFLDWMTVEQHIRYVATFYPSWDLEREKRLRDDLELDGDALVGLLSPGNGQKLALVLALGHHPELLVLDEPVSALDPIARNKLLAFLVELLEEDRATVIVSSHVLRDIERIVDRLVCLDHGKVTADSSLDELKETFAEWRVTSRGGQLPAAFSEPYVLRQEVERLAASLLVRQTDSELEDFRHRYGVEVEIHPLNLERMFELLIAERPA